MGIEARPDSRGLRGRERIVERRGAVGVQVVMHEHDRLGGGKCSSASVRRAAARSLRVSRSRCGSLRSSTRYSARSTPERRRPAPPLGCSCVRRPRSANRSAPLRAHSCRPAAGCAHGAAVVHRLRLCARWLRVARCPRAAPWPCGFFPCARRSRIGVLPFQCREILQRAVGHDELPLQTVRSVTIIRFLVRDHKTQFRRTLERRIKIENALRGFARHQRRQATETQGKWRLGGWRLADGQSWKAGTGSRRTSLQIGKT